jgi:murein L,D-transpeptidase YafK
MIKRLLLGITLFLLLSAAAWYWQEDSSNCESCLPMPDLTSFLHPAPKLELPYPAPPASEVWDTWNAEQRLADVTQRVQPRLKEELIKRSFSFGAYVYLRAFKEERLLELWLQSNEGWKLWRSYPIAAASGRLGPKLREGDYQVPEGFYTVTTRQLNPASRYHLAFNIGYPNAYDQHHQRTGSFIMIHGREVSIGCLAMTDPAIEEIFLLVQAALGKGQPSVPIHLFPFRLSEERLQASAGDPWEPFWRHELLPTWQHFETTHQVPEPALIDGRYHFRD